MSENKDFTVLGMVKHGLMSAGFDGLCSECGECSCELADLAPCGQIGADCEGGHKVACDGDTCFTGDCDFHIFPGPRPEKGEEGK